MRHFHEELKELKEQLVSMGLAVAQAIEKAVQSLFERNNELAHEVIDSDENAVNQFEIEIDERVRSLSALQQPAAYDMRVLASIYKMNTDLERIGDHAVNIAERALLLNEQPPLETNIHLNELTNAAQKMLRDALQAFIHEDVELAREVLKRDDEVDDYNDADRKSVV